MNSHISRSISNCVNETYRTYQPNQLLKPRNASLLQCFFSNFFSLSAQQNKKYKHKVGIVRSIMVKEGKCGQPESLRPNVHYIFTRALRKCLPGFYSASPWKLFGSWMYSPEIVLQITSGKSSESQRRGSSNYLEEASRVTMRSSLRSPRGSPLRHSEIVSQVSARKFFGSISWMRISR